MAFKPFNLADEFVDEAAEQGLLVSLVGQPDLYWQLIDWLPVGTFHKERATWELISASIESQAGSPVLPAAWGPCLDPMATAQRLSDLYQRRLLADAQQRVAQALYSGEQTAAQVARMLEDEAGRVQGAVQQLQTGQVRYAKELMGAVLRYIVEQHQRHLENADPIRGLRTGLAKLDDLLSGFGTGLYLLAGAPGVGKTTLALQMAATVAARGTPVIYVSYENSAENLILKLISSKAGVNTQMMERGQVDLKVINQAAAALDPVLQRLVILEGTSRLTPEEVKAKALRIQRGASDKRCLIIFDYLQRAAHAQGYEQIRHNVSQLAGTLRDLSNRLDSPVLALCSQNRSGGQYGVGGGSASLDSLKESGDLEYSADAVMFLCPSERRQATAPCRAVDLVLAKNRYGDLGLIPLIFRPDVGQLREEGR